jgi:hypothetical protein
MNKSNILQLKRVIRLKGDCWKGVDFSNKEHVIGKDCIDCPFANPNPEHNYCKSDEDALHNGKERKFLHDSKLLDERVRRASLLLKEHKLEKLHVLQEL